MMDDPQSKRRILAWLHGCPCKALSRRREQMVGSLRSAIRAPRIVQGPVSWLCQPIRGSGAYPEHLMSGGLSRVQRRTSGENFTQGNSGKVVFGTIWQMLSESRGQTSL
jgi:hypothetical protein